MHHSRRLITKGLICFSHVVRLFQVTLKHLKQKKKNYKNPRRIKMTKKYDSDICYCNNNQAKL